MSVILSFFHVQLIYLYPTSVLLTLPSFQNLFQFQLSRIPLAEKVTQMWLLLEGESKRYARENESEVFHVCVVLVYLHFRVSSPNDQITSEYSEYFTNNFSDVKCSRIYLGRLLCLSLNDTRINGKIALSLCLSLCLYVSLSLSFCLSLMPECKGESDCVRFYVLYMNNTNFIWNCYYNLPTFFCDLYELLNK